MFQSDDNIVRQRVMDKHSLGLVRIFVAGDIEKSICESRKANDKVMARIRRHTKIRLRQ